MHCGCRSHIIIVLIIIIYLLFLEELEKQSTDVCDLHGFLTDLQPTKMQISVKVLASQDCVAYISSDKRYLLLFLCMYLS